VKSEIRILFLVFVTLIHSLSAEAGTRDLSSALATDDAEVVHVDLYPRDSHPGFETDIDGDDPRLESLVAVIIGAEPGCGHKCPNRGMVRFRMVGGRVISVGLLPSHEEDVFGLRLYDGDRLQGVLCVQRATLVAAFERLAVPVDGPAFRD
jgi:hypothetical protein